MQLISSQWGGRFMSFQGSRGEDSSNFQAVGGKFGLVTSISPLPPYKSIIFKQWGGKNHSISRQWGGSLKPVGGKFGIPGWDAYFRTSGGESLDHCPGNFPTSPPTNRALSDNPSATVLEHVFFANYSWRLQFKISKQGRVYGGAKGGLAPPMPKVSPPISPPTFRRILLHALSKCMRKGSFSPPNYNPSPPSSPPTQNLLEPPLFPRNSIESKALNNSKFIFNVDYFAQLKPIDTH